MTVMTKAPAPPTPAPMPTAPATLTILVSSAAMTETVPPASTLTSPLMEARVVVEMTTTAAEPPTAAPPEPASPRFTEIWAERATAVTDTSPAAETSVAKSSVASPEWASVAESGPPSAPIHALVSPVSTGTDAAGAVLLIPEMLTLLPMASSR